MMLRENALLSDRIAAAQARMAAAMQAADQRMQALLQNYEKKA